MQYTKKAVSFAIVTAMLMAFSLAHAKGKKQVSGVVNINTASIAELAMLPGVGPSKAQAILDYRKERPFQKPEDLKEVKGIGEKLFAALSSHVVVSGTSTITALETGAPAQSAPQAKPAPGAAGKAF